MIIIINGPDDAANSLLANSLRNTQISQGKGALLADVGQDGDPRHQLEKIIAGDTLEESKAFAERAGQELIDAIPWKPEPAIILVGEQEALLEKLEALVPGLTGKFGPVTRMGAA